ncbi:SDR family NAD(P)-dependent oxidoreductase, partial [Chloroflexota bacterium]
GARVCIADADAEGGQKATEQLLDAGHKAVFCHVDVTDEVSLERAVHATIEAYGRVDVVVANAGINYDGHVADTPLTKWQKVLDVNLTGSFLTAKVFTRYLLEQGEGGRIIFASSEAGKKGEAGASAYVASKFAVIGLLECLALELAPHGITVNGVCPGMIDSDMLRWVAQEYAQTAGSTFEDVWQEFHDIVPMKRLGSLEEVANTYVFLASHLADYITGETINVDGGRLPG